MAVTASRIFQHLEHRPVLSITRHEITCHAFTQLRRAMYALVVGLRDEETGDTELSDRLRQALSEWLTVPLPFAELRTATLDELGTSAFVGIRWGDDMRRCFDVALHSLHATRETPSPLRAQLAQVMRDASSRELRWRIYCHRSAAEHFTSCAAEVGSPICPGTFIHSLRDYRNAEPFDLLIKVGPLRARGWGSFPNACLNASRYRELVQIVWTGMGDEPGFGDDPLVAPWAGASTMGGSERGQSAPATGPSSGRQETATPAWSCTVIAHADLSGVGSTRPAPDEQVLDELQSFARMGRVHAPRRAMLLHIGDGLGVLYPPNADVLLLSPGAPPKNAVSRCALAEVDPRGRFVVRADIGDVNLGAHLTEHGWYSTRWKAELKRQFSWHAEGLLRRLQAAGIRLRNLRECVEHWIQPASTVIHAPQQSKHFEFLIDVLEMNSREPRPGARKGSGPWWRAAWQEIAASRGLAIQFGMQEQEIIGEEVDRIVLTILPEIRERALGGEPFRVSIPPGHSLEGSISFLPIREVEEGFCVPESCLKIMMQVSRAEEWRA